MTATASAHWPSSALSQPSPRVPIVSFRGAPVVTQVGMPHLDIAGLSEAWLFRHAGHLHWTAIHQSLGIAAHELRNDRDERLYASFVAVRARYGAPLADVREDDRLVAQAMLRPCGRASAESELEIRRGSSPPWHLSMASTFAAFAEAGGIRRLRASPLAAALGAAWAPVAATSPLLSWAKDARRGLPVNDPAWAAALHGARAHAKSSASHRVRLLPSPYTDYNHAGLLYFASFVSLADTAEHLLLSPGGSLAHLAPGKGPWCGRVSPVERDVLYHGNLPCGEPVEAELVSLETRGDRVVTFLRLWRASDQSLLADLLATKVRR